jgi:hypothetical protein
MGRLSQVELSDGQLEKIAAELREIAHGSSWSRTLATGELVLKHFFGGNVDEWRTRRRQKESSIRRLAQRPDCPLGKSALSEAVTIYVARKDLPKCVDELTPSHVAIALRLPPAQRLAILEKAVADAWSVREMRGEALLLNRRAGERRGRPRFSQARAALSQFKVGLDALETGIELLGVSSDADPETLGLLDRALAALDARLEDARARVAALSGPGLRSSPKASLIVPADAARKRAVG